MSKFTGNIIRLPAVTPTQNSASGVYTLDDQFTAQSSGTWPIVRDQYFNYTTLLLTGAVQGTAYPNPVTQPYSFLSDASTNNFVVSPNGDVSARPFNPYLNNYSNYFSGSGQYLSSASNAAFGMGSGDYTIECWVYITATSTYDGIYSTTGTTSSDIQVQLNNRLLRVSSYTAQTVIANAGTEVSLNTWTHVAFCRSGTTLKLYKNGQEVGSGTDSINWAAGAIEVGRVFGSLLLTGYMSNLRVVKGQALYTSAFTPTTSPLTTTSQGATAGNVSLLTCQSNRFIDNSSTPKTITVTGTPAVSQNSPFVSYDTTNGSGYFDGNGDWLASSSATAIGTSSFTFETWAYMTNTSGTRYFYNSKNAGSNGVGILYTASSSQIILARYGTANDLTASYTFPANEWVHIVVTRSGTGANQTAIFANGSRLNVGQVTTSYTANGFEVGGESASASNSIAGYLSNTRLVIGSSVYDPSLTTLTNTLTGATGVPTAPLQAITNTSLLTLQTRAPATNNGFIDSSPNNFVVTRNGNATQGSFSPFSPTGWGNYFNGTSFISVADSTAIQLGSGDFTMEFWVYFPAGFTGAQWLLGKGDTATTAGTLASFYSSQFEFCSGSTTYALTTPTWASGRWYSVSIVRSGSGANNLKLYIDGGFQSQASIGSNTINTGGSNALKIGQYVGSAPQSYISNFRLIKGQGLYTGAYTPATGPLTTTSVGTTGTNVATSITGTVSLLTCQSNRFIDNSPNNFTITASSSPSVQAFSPFAPAQSYIPSQIGGSGYFDGTGSGTAADYLTWPGSAIGTSPFCFECWFYTSGFGSAQALLGPNSTSSGGISVRIITSTRIDIDRYSVASSQFTVPTMTANQWYHLVACRDASNNTTIFLNGVRSSTGTISDSYNYGNAASIGYLNSAFPLVFTGNIAGARLVTGSTPYDPTQTTITVPTAPPTAIPNTSLLLNFTNGGIVDATGKNNLETVANSGVQTSIINPFGSRTGLMYFNGSSYFYEPYTQLMNQLNGNFTIECWIYPTATNTRMLFAGSVNSTGVTNWYFEITSANKLRFEWDNTSTFFEAISSASIAQNTWTYVAVVRNGGTITQYINGSADGTASPTGTYKNASYPLSIGRAGDYNGLYFTGYIDEFRMAYVARTITASPTGPFPLG